MIWLVCHARFCIDIDAHLLLRFVRIGDPFITLALCAIFNLQSLHQQ